VSQTKRVVLIEGMPSMFTFIHYGPIYTDRIRL
jgi:hypothetical protein